MNQQDGVEVSSEFSPFLRLLWACVAVAALHMVLSGLAALRWW